MNKEIDVYYCEETEPNIHTYNNGARSCYIDKIYVSRSERPTKVKLDGSTVPIEVGIPTELTRERLLIGVDAGKKKINFQFLKFKKHPHDECWLIDNSPCNIFSFTTKTMLKITKIIEEFSK